MTVRRSVALPKELIDEVQTVAPIELRDNLNRLVIVALQDFAARQKAHAFEEAMAQWRQMSSCKESLTRSTKSLR